MSFFCGSGAYANILYDPVNNEVTKVNNTENDLLGLRYPTEHDITCRLSHPHLLSAKRITPEGYLVFDYYPHTIWNDKILNLPLSQRKILLHQLLSAVEALHNFGYIHLDIKGDNVLVNEEGAFLVLADFGSALFIGAEEGKSSPRDRIIDDLKSPELLLAKLNKKETIYTRASDYWSLGLLCLEVLLGKPSQYRKKTPKDIYADRETNLATLINRVDDEWQSYLRHLLAWNEKERKHPILVHPELHEHPIQSSGSRLECKKTLLLSARQWINICGVERVEAFFLATDLFHRTISLPFNRKELFMTCYWLALKVIEGVSVDPREIDPDGDQIKDICKIELKIIQHLRGRLYYPNSFTQAKSRQDLLVAWRYLYSRRQAKDKFTLEKYPGKVNFTLEQYFYYLGELNI